MKVTFVFVVPISVIITFFPTIIIPIPFLPKLVNRTIYLVIYFSFLGKILGGIPLNLWEIIPRNIRMGILYFNNFLHGYVAERREPFHHNLDIMLFHSCPINLFDFANYFNFPIVVIIGITIMIN